MFAGHWGKVDAFKVSLTYVVPYLVSSISAWLTLRQNDAVK